MIKKIKISQHFLSHPWYISLSHLPHFAPPRNPHTKVVPLSLNDHKPLMSSSLCLRIPWLKSRHLSRQKWELGAEVDHWLRTKFPKLIPLSSALSRPMNYITEISTSLGILTRLAVGDVRLPRMMLPEEPSLRLLILFLTNFRGFSQNEVLHPELQIANAPPPPTIIGVIIFSLKPSQTII